MSFDLDTGLVLSTLERHSRKAATEISRAAATLAWAKLALTSAVLAAAALLIVACEVQPPSDDGVGETPPPARAEPVGTSASAGEQPPMTAPEVEAPAQPAVDPVAVATEPPAPQPTEQVAVTVEVEEPPVQESAPATPTLVTTATEATEPESAEEIASELAEQSASTTQQQTPAAPAARPATTARTNPATSSNNGGAQNSSPIVSRPDDTDTPMDDAGAGGEMPMAGGETETGSTLREESGDEMPMAGGESETGSMLEMEQEAPPPFIQGPREPTIWWGRGRQANREPSGYFGSWAWWEPFYSAFRYENKSGFSRPRPCEQFDADTSLAPQSEPVVRLGRYHPPRTPGGRFTDYTRVALNVCLVGGPVPASDLEIVLEITDTNPPTLDADAGIPTVVTIPAGRQTATITLPIANYEGVADQPITVQLADGPDHDVIGDGVDVYVNGYLNKGNRAPYYHDRIDVGYAQRIAEDATSTLKTIHMDLASIGFHLDVEDIEIREEAAREDNWYSLTLSPTFLFDPRELVVRLEEGVERVIDAWAPYVEELITPPPSPGG